MMLSKTTINKLYLYYKNKFIYIYFIILLILIYLLYNNLNNNYEKFIVSPSSNPTPTSILFNGFGTGSWTVPAGITQATFTVIGGSGDHNRVGDGGGDGAKVIATLTELNPGDTYYIFVGENGGRSADTNNYFGGGAGSAGNLIKGSGGAGSFVSLNNNTTFKNTQNATTIIIVAGGGGAAGNYYNGGYAGINSNGDGLNGTLATGAPSSSIGIGGIGGTLQILGSGTSGGTPIKNAGGGGGGSKGGTAGSDAYAAGGGAGGSYVNTLYSTNYSFARDNTRSPSIKIDWTVFPTTTQPPTTTIGGTPTTTIGGTPTTTIGGTPTTTIGGTPTTTIGGTPTTTIGGTPTTTIGGTPTTTIGGTPTTTSNYLYNSKTDISSTFFPLVKINKQK